MSTIALVPSLPAQSWEELHSLATAVQSVTTELQVDIVDGVFVAATAWPFTEAAPTQALLRLAELSVSLALELDCMVDEPRQYFSILKTLPITRLIVHYGSCVDITETIEEATACGWHVGVACTNDVPLEAVMALVPLVSYVQVMGIATVGAQGQPFDERTIDTIRTLRAEFPMLPIAVDGSVNAVTIPRLIAAGATRLAPGSAIAKQANPAVAYRELAALINDCA